MKKLILAGTFVLATTAAQAQYLVGTESNPNSHPIRAYTSAGPAGAGVYREEPLRTNPGSTQADKYGTRSKLAGRRRAQPATLSN
jgi:hypothetical protein